MRANVSWKIKDIKDEESRNKINKWCDNQEKIQVSLTSLVLHMIDRFGYKNITDHEIQKLLHQEFPLTGINTEEAIFESVKEIEKTHDTQTSQKKIETEEKNPVPVKEQSSDDEKDNIYNQIDTNAL
ncbi:MULTISPECIES: hypothetical protein [Bacillus cereus group]|uniref:hypothetical protein n=1 Tax=Bacillus cereus group TaxID=86661 RepID=UPI0013C14AA3|nr:hypothetical protein [Bacillus cereus]MEC2466413.1 hypothetical protein [Bacillus cereus]MRC87318.1 hypothetical protein [Bacillus thuringiensis]HDR6957813.1 hypothetical protein [Bacillus cereus]